MKKTTITGVAQRAGVSISTVSRVLNGNRMVDRELRERVESAVRELSYVPNRFARGIRKKNEPLVGVIIPTAADVFFSRLLESIAGAAEQSRLRIMLFSCHGNPANELPCLELAARSGLDGLLYCPSAALQSERVFGIFPGDFPLVVIYRRAVVPGVPHIYHDNIQGGYLAAKYLLHQGRRNIAFFASFWHIPREGRGLDAFLAMLQSETRGFYSALDRLDGYIRAMGEYGLELKEELFFPVSGFSFEAGYRGTKNFLSRICNFDAVFCGNDEVAAGVMQSLQEQNYAVPGTVSVIGYDDSAFASAVRPMLTTIRQDPAPMGRGAVAMILERMEGRPVSDQRVEASLVVRDSTAVKTESPADP
jgi:DNA-binding LacI/PurR family transcriptional regulator